MSAGDIGPAGPVRLLAASASGSWVAVCEGAGDGSTQTARLVLGAGAGEPIDDVLARDPTGRYLVTSRAGAIEVIDAVTATRVSLSELGADVRRLRDDYAEHRSLSFDPSGRYLAYLRGPALAPRIVVRELETNEERTFAVGRGEILRLRLSADARYVVYDAIREDSNHNGKLDWPAPEEPKEARACAKAPLPKFRSFAYQGRSDAVVRGVVALDTGLPRDVPELVTPLGASLLVREADGSLRLDDDGKRTPLSPAGCGARVLFADAARGLVLAACAPPAPPKRKDARTTQSSASGKREVWLFGRGFAKNLQSELYETSTDREAVVGTRLVPVYPGSEARLLDLERRDLLPLPSGSRVLSTLRAWALIWRGNELVRYDAQTRTEQVLARGVSKNPELLHAGSSVLLTPFVIVGLDGPALASPARPLALTASGFVLTGSESKAGAEARSTLHGPLHWWDARLPAPDGPPR